MAMTRRRMITTGVLGSAALAAGGLGFWSPAATTLPVTGLKAFDAAGFGVLTALAEVVCPRRGGWPSAAELKVAEQVDALVGRMHPADKKELGLALRLLDNALAGLLLDGRPQPFSRSDVATREATLERWRTSRLSLRRTIYRSLVGLVLGAYYSDPAVFVAVGYPGPPSGLNTIALSDG
jgi:hypothetical protein